MVTFKDSKEFINYKNKHGGLYDVTDYEVFRGPGYSGIPLTSKCTLKLLLLCRGWDRLYARNEILYYVRGRTS